VEFYQKNKMLDLNKPIMTRSGYPFRLYANDGGGKFPLHGAYQYDGWNHHSWTIDGKFSGMNGKIPNRLDLINVPDEHAVWINWYPDHEDVYKTQDEAECNRDIDFVTCTKVAIYAPTEEQDEE